MIPSAQLYLVGDFNVETFARYLANTALEGARVEVAPAGPVSAALATGPPGDDWTAVVWTRPEMISPAFQRALDFEPFDAATAIADVTRFGHEVIAFARRCRAVLLPTWVVPSFVRGWGVLDWRPRLGVASLLAGMNLALADAFASEPSIVVLDANRWMTTVGERGWSQKSWYAAKSPFTPEVLQLAAADVVSAIDGFAGRARRAIILDLDDVLWGGAVGESGPLGVRIGGHDHVGEAFADFQRALKALSRRGVLLAIVSKNDETVALEAIDRHPEMQLRREDFAAWRINWDDKAGNVAAVLAELNLGAESAVFVDDQAIERARVRSTLPDILVPDWPQDPSRFRETLESLPCFDAPSVTAEDRGRAGMMAADRSRRAAAAASAGVEDWLQSLAVRVVAEPLGDANIERASQLFNKTNQMNLSTRRMTSADLAAWAASPDNLVLTFRVADRFGDSGLTGLVGLHIADTEAQLVDFLVSCRVMGRRVEEAMLHVAIAQARMKGAATLRARFLPTPRNAPCLEFFRRCGMREVGASEFMWSTGDAFSRPSSVTVA